MWIVCITSVRHVLTVNGYGGRQTKENEKSWCFKGWETLVNNLLNIDNKLNFFNLTNFYFVGSKRDSKKARFGRSKEKQSDAIMQSPLKQATAIYDKLKYAPFRKIKNVGHRVHSQNC